MTRRLTSSELLAMRVLAPQPGQRTVRVKVRLPYQTGFTTIRVDAEQYEAARAPRPTLDLDALCAAAQQRLAHQVRVACGHAAMDLKRDFALARERLGLPLYAEHISAIGYEPGVRVLSVVPIGEPAYYIRTREVAA